MPPDIDPRNEPALVEALEDYHQRAALGEAVPLGLYQERLGAHFADFQAVVRAEQALDEAMAAPHEPTAEALPRPFGSFTLVREVGRGGVGVVYEAVDRRLGRKLAVKVLKVSFDTDDVARERFRREASACARVRDDHIVPIFESGEIEGQPYYAMDLVPGDALSDLIRDGRAPPPRDLCRQLANVADALEALHAEGVIHRDVKPHNLMVRPDGRMVLTDFGLARTQGAGTLTQTGQALGTPLYMSPEQVHGDAKRIAATTDVYGLGAVLYEALTGHPPFAMSEYPRLLNNILFVRPEPLRAIAPAVPEACERIALKALEKEPSDRYPTAAAMAADLRAYAEERPVLGRPLSRQVRAWRWVQARRVPLAAAALVVLAGSWFWRHRPATLFIERGAPRDLEVSLNGEAPGRLPFEASLPPGEHRVVMRRRLFVDYDKTLRVEAGDRVWLPVMPLLPDPTLPDLKDREEAARLLAEGLGFAPLSPEAPSLVDTREPTGPTPALTVLAPRGRVRPQDLGAWWVEVDAYTYVGGGTLELRAGERVLWSAPFVPDLRPLQPWACGRIPREATNGLAPGTPLALRWSPPAGAEVQPVSVELELVGDAMAAPALTEIDAGLAPAAGVWRAHFRVEALRKASLTAAAFLEARSAARSDPRDRRAWGSLLRIVRDDLGLGRLQLSEDLDAWLRGTRADLPALCSTDGS